VGEKLFASLGDVSPYFFGIMPFPEDKPKEPSSPTKNVRVSFLSSMFLIGPRDRHTAANWLIRDW